jgi:hypothetical protein
LSAAFSPAIRRGCHDIAARRGAMVARMRNVWESQDMRRSRDVCVLVYIYDINTFVLLHKFDATRSMSATCIICFFFSRLSRLCPPPPLPPPSPR